MFIITGELNKIICFVVNVLFDKKCDINIYNKGGINKSKEVSLPINKSFITSFNETNSLYPLGNEVYFLSEKNEIIALSRTTKLELI